MKKLSTLLVLYLFCSTVPALAVSKADLMANDAMGRLPSKSFPESGAEYWRIRVQAIDLVKEKEWEKSIPLLVKLTHQYKDDGDTWFLLGHAYLQTEQYGKAIPAFEKTLQLGTIMTGVDSASPPSNDIMINLAQCYSAIGDKQQALIWIKKALDLRWDDRKTLIKNSKFSTIYDDDAYKKLSGELVDPNLSRNKGWILDLEFLLDEIKRIHVNPYHSISAEQLESKAKAIERDIPELSDQQIVFRFMELLASTKNGHNFIVPTHSLKGSFSQLPVQFYWFNDGVYIVDAKDGSKHLIGREVVSVETTPVEQVMEKIAIVNARDNEMQQYWLAPYYLALPEVLEGLNIAKDKASVAFTLANKNGTKEQVKFSGESFSFRGFPTLPPVKSIENPTFLKNKSDNYWYEINEKNNYLYLQFNAVAQKESQSLAEFSKEIKTFAKKSQVENLILDLRHNSGGNGSIIPPLTRALIHFTEQAENNKLFIIVGRNTFSAAHLLLADLNRLTDAVIVGEPSGSRPNHRGEAGWFQLPYSGVWGIISSQYHQASKAEDHRLWVAPHLPVTLSSEAYFLGKDPVMTQIITIIQNK